MKKICFFLILIVLLVSCDQNNLPVVVKIENKADAPVYWQLRSYTETPSSLFFRMGKSEEKTVCLKHGELFVLSVAGLETEAISVVENALLVNATSGQLKQIVFKTMLSHGNITFIGNDSDIDCEITFRPL